MLFSMQTADLAGNGLEERLLRHLKNGVGPPG